jgi:hypothetical protein
LNYEQKCQLAIHLYHNHKINKHYLQYLPTHHFLEMFSSNRWKEQNFADFILNLMSDNKNLFIEKLMNLAE